VHEAVKARHAAQAPLSQMFEQQSLDDEQLPKSSVQVTHLSL
jgi:hypothetical protein